MSDIDAFSHDPQACALEYLAFVDHKAADNSASRPLMGAGLALRRQCSLWRARRFWFTSFVALSRFSGVILLPVNFNLLYTLNRKLTVSPSWTM